MTEFIGEITFLSLLFDKEGNIFDLSLFFDLLNSLNTIYFLHDLFSSKIFFDVCKLKPVLLKMGFSLEEFISLIDLYELYFCKANSSQLLFLLILVFFFEKNPLPEHIVYS